MQLKITTWCLRIQGRSQLPGTRGTAFYCSLIYVFWASQAVVFHSVPLAFCFKWGQWIFYSKSDTLMGRSSSWIIIESGNTDAMMLYQTFRIISGCYNSGCAYSPASTSVAGKTPWNVWTLHAEWRSFNTHLISTSYSRLLVSGQNCWNSGSLSRPHNYIFFPHNNTEKKIQRSG